MFHIGEITLSATLVVVDMQIGFHSANNPYTISNVVREIKQARKRKAGIVMVQYENSGCLIRDVERATRNYSNIDFVWKNCNDGWVDVYHSIENNCFDLRNLTVCGVNADACVAETVFSLSINLPESTIELVEDACNTDGAQWKRDIFDWVNELPNVILREED